MDENELAKQIAQAIYDEHGAKYIPEDDEFWPAAEKACMKITGETLNDSLSMFVEWKFRAMSNYTDKGESFLSLTEQDKNPVKESTEEKSGPKKQGENNGRK
jgi:hypothetical protein